MRKGIFDMDWFDAKLHKNELEWISQKMEQWVLCWVCRVSWDCPFQMGCRYQAWPHFWKWTCSGQVCTENQLFSWSTALFEPWKVAQISDSPWLCNRNIFHYQMVQISSSPWICNINLFHYQFFLLTCWSLWEIHCVSIFMLIVLAFKKKNL